MKLDCRYLTVTIYLFLYWCSCLQLLFFCLGMFWRLFSESLLQVNESLNKSSNFVLLLSWYWTFNRFNSWQSCGFKMSGLLVSISISNFMPKLYTVSSNSTVSFCSSLTSLYNFLNVLKPPRHINPIKLWLVQIVSISFASHCSIVFGFLIAACARFMSIGSSICKV
jgi:hypothetical protein